MMLHLIVQAPVENAILARIDSGDDVVFQLRAVWNALAGHAMQRQLEGLIQENCRLYVLHDDLEVSGIEPDRLLSGVKIIDYRGLVELVADNEVCKTWS